jgi:hypothetical protein
MTKDEAIALILPWLIEEERFISYGDETKATTNANVMTALTCNQWLVGQDKISKRFYIYIE